MITLYIVRHGESENNLRGRINGQIDTPLTVRGQKEAKKTGIVLGRFHLDEIYSSDLGRAFMTAYLINEQIGHKHKINVSREIRETNYGIYQNREKAQVKLDCPEFKKDASFVYPEGESAVQTQNRAIQFIKKLEKNNNNKNVLVVTHAALIRTVVAFFLDLPLEKQLNRQIPHEYIGKFIIDKGKLVDYRQII